MPVLVVYILENGADRFREQGGARKWWLNQSLIALHSQLEDIGGKLILKSCGTSDVKSVFSTLLSEHKVGHVFWNRRYAPAETEKDKKIKAYLKDAGVIVESFNGSLLMEPWELQTLQGNSYKVFTPFWKTLKSDYQRKHPKGVPDLRFAESKSEALADWKLHPENPDWSEGLIETWTPGSAGAKSRLTEFLDRTLKGYSENRDRPDLPGTSFPRWPGSDLCWWQRSPARLHGWNASSRCA